MPLTAIWIASALLALIAEFFSGTFYLLVVAVAMLCGGAAAWLGAPEASQYVIASIAGVAGVALVYGYKRRHPRAPFQPRADDPDLGQPVQVLHAPASGHLRVQYRGAAWDAAPVDGAPLETGATAYIVGRDGNLLKISSTQPEQ
ncbi:membrane protein implicated in regulation of membrane protease activity [Chromobacterium alkanivorans]|uniref:NfeD family protein n=1 Tax=Chromobacterium alkanivorans TaxID=1071719 RepID=UPI0021690DB0|nr:NfeD family protein [Chromobacterium alkanivorans]MCS3806643.1 membrane protein implicated in regulation of membrane protease activity [Chromobacterium alkanivorans]MCS3820981.1 membrane protein implicated in regulation of membrane protease activity [Chromobacterium alkanivorans]MCS3875903.1 membrane protein implicated in regulation of membrane protease activity [Chromobacterium alkanivorans]